MNLSDIHIVDESRRFYTAFCPYHDDRNTPNMKIDKKTGVYHCYACGSHGQIELDENQERYSKRAIQKVPINWPLLSNMYSHLTGWIKVLECAKQLKVLPYTMQQLGVGWDGEAWTFPVKDAKLNMIGIMRRFPDGSKSMVSGSSIGIYAPLYLQESVADTLIIAEGASDVAAVMPIYPDVIGKFNCQVPHDIIQEFIRYHSIRQIVIIPDADDPGVKGATKLADRLLRDVDQMSIHPSEHGDLRNWITKDYSNAKETILSWVQSLRK